MDYNTTKSVVFYAPNILDYIRIIFVVLMLINMRSRPFLSFAFCLLSGQVDLWDGDLGRHLNQTSKFGCLLDKGMDLLTNSAQMFVLATVYPKYWIFFFNVSIISLSIDFTGFYVDIYKMKTELFYDGDLALTKAKYALELGINFINSTAKSENENNFNELKGSSFDYFNSLNIILERGVLYTSDLFYWLIYLGYFMSNNINNNNLKKKFIENFSPSRNNEYFLLNTQCTESIQNSNFNEFRDAFDGLVDYLDFNLRKFSLTKRFIVNCVNVKILMRVLGIVCFFGAIAKFCFHFVQLVENFSSIVQIENKFNELKKSSFK
jgi:phosphatidylglycerophosphate synthase